MTKEGKIDKMKMVIAIVHDHDAQNLLEALNKDGFQVTKMASTGGFLREGNTTFLIGTDEDHLHELKEIIKENCRTRQKTIAPMSPVANTMESYYTFPMEVQIGGATLFVINVEEFLKM